MWFNQFFNIYLGDKQNATKRKLAKFENNIIFQNVFARLLQDALDRYSFEGLPDTCSERVILQSLFWYGSCVFFEKDGELMALPGIPSGNGFNVYGDIASAWVFSMNGKFNEKIELYLPGSDKLAFLNKTNGINNTGSYRGVFIRENAIMFPFVRHTMQYAKAIADSIRTLDVCRQNIKQPFVITAEESIVNSVKKFFEQRNDNVEYIISTGVFPADKINLLPFETNSDNLNNATQLIDWYENKYRELLGVENNGQMDKKGENLINAEIDVNDEYTEKAIDKTLKYIQQGLDLVNELFGYNITVKANKKEDDEYDDVSGDSDRTEESLYSED